MTDDDDGDTLAGYLRADHAAFDALLCRAIVRPVGFDLDAFASFRARLARHIAIEDALLLPALSAKTARDVRVQHAALTLLLRASPSRRLVGQLRQLLLLHVGLEEGPGGALEEHAGITDAREQRALGRRARLHPFRPPDDDGARVRTAAAALAAAERIVAA